VVTAENNIKETSLRLSDLITKEMIGLGQSSRAKTVDRRRFLQFYSPTQCGGTQAILQADVRTIGVWFRLPIDKIGE